MKVTHRLHETISGAPLSMQFPCKGDWQVQLNSPGSGTFDLVLANSRYLPADWRAATAPWWMSIVEYHDGIPKYAGMIVDKTWDPWRKTLQLDTKTSDALLDDRYILGVGNLLAGTPTDTQFQVVSKSLRAAAAQVIMRGIGQNGGDLGWDWGLPYRFTNTTEAGTFTQSWPFHDWKTVGDIVRYIQSLENGPDIAFIPAVDATGNLVLDVRIGNPRIDGPTIDLPMSTRKSRVHRPLFRTFGRDMLTGAFAKIEGVGKDAADRVGLAGTPSDETRIMPVRDAAINVEDESADPTGIAKAHQAAKAAVVRQDEFGLLHEDDVNAFPLPVEDVKLGARLSGRYSGDEYLDPETMTYYVTKLSYNSSEPHVYIPEVQRI